MVMLVVSPLLAAQVPSLSLAPPVTAVGTGASLAAKVQQPQSSIVTAVPEDFSKLRICPGFLLHMEVFDTPEMSADLRVDEQGNIALPVAGVVHVAGLSASQARVLIQKKFVDERVLKQPQVSLNVQQYAPFYISVLGEVQNPGRLQLLASHNLLDVISQAGGATALAGNKVRVDHFENGVHTVHDYPFSRYGDKLVTADVMVHEGDTVIVPRAGIVYVLGAVNRAGGYLMQEDGELDVAQALSLAGGTALQAKVGAIRVVRREPNGRATEIPIDYRAISKGQQKPLVLQAEDIVYVPVSKIKAVFTSGSAVIGQTASATIYAVR
jgi:polysaccharide export outer membrane protein